MRNSITMGLDLDDQFSFYCVLDEMEEIVLEGKVRTTLPMMERWLERMAPAVVHSRLPQTLEYRRNHPLHQNLLRPRKRTRSQLPGPAKPHASRACSHVLLRQHPRPRYPPARNGQIRQTCRQTPLRHP